MAAPSADGTVFKITPGGTLTTLHSFDRHGRRHPYGGLVQGTNGNFYGTTDCGGANGECGTVFKITPSGTLTTLHSFCRTAARTAHLPTRGWSRPPMGTSTGQRTMAGPTGYGTVFKITPSGTLTTLHSFVDTDRRRLPIRGAGPGHRWEFLRDNVSGRGHMTYGTVFKITPSGTLTTLHSFSATCTDGADPYGGWSRAPMGTSTGQHTPAGPTATGTVFKITPSGTLTTLHSFERCTDGANPYAGLVQATDGNFYGTTRRVAGPIGVWHGLRDHPSGTLTTLYSFRSDRRLHGRQTPTRGWSRPPMGSSTGQLRWRDSTSATSCGTVFSLYVGLGQFVETLPTSGKVGAAVKILGSNLTGATSVTFNGTAATFTVNSKSEITTTVPTGATTGTVQVITPRLGTLSSNVPFTVRP